MYYDLLTLAVVGRATVWAAGETVPPGDVLRMTQDSSVHSPIRCSTGIHKVDTNVYS